MNRATRTSLVLALAASGCGSWSVSEKPPGASRQLLYAFEGGEHPKESSWHEGVSSLAFSPDGSLLAAASNTNEAPVWSMKDGSLAMTLAVHSEMHEVVFSPDGDTIATWNNRSDESIALFTRKGERRRSLGSEAPDGFDFPGSPRFLADGTCLLTRGSLSGIAIRRVDDGSRVASMTDLELLEILGKTSHDGILYSAHVAKNGHLVLVFGPVAGGKSRDLVLVWFDPVARVTARTLVLPACEIKTWAYPRFVLSPDERLAAVWLENAPDTVTLWSLVDGTRGPTIDAKDSGALFSFTTDGRRLAVGSGDGTIRVYSTGDGKLLTTLAGGHAARVTALAFSPSGDLLASGAEDRTVRVWRTP
jgi:WD40 repeat protein